MTATSLDLSQIRTDALSSAATFRTLIGLGSGDTPTFKGATLSTGTITASTPAVDVTQTWNNAGVTFTGSKLNIVDTASASGSNLIDLQVNSVSQFRVVSGEADFGSGSTNRPAIYSRLINIRSFYGSAFILNGAGANNGLKIGQNAAGYLDIGQGGFQVVNLSGSCSFAVESTNVFAQRNTTSAQTFRIYNTTDSGIANYERGKLEWSSDVFRIGTEKAGTGSARALELQTDGTTRLTIASTGTATFGGRVVVPEYITDNLNNEILAGVDSSGYYFGCGFTSNTYPIFLGAKGAATHVYIAGTTGVICARGKSIAFGTTTSNTSLISESSGTLSLINQANAQTFRLYGTYTDASNYRRLAISSTTAGAFTINAEGAGTGASGNTLELQTGGTTRLTFAASSHDITADPTARILIGANTTGRLIISNSVNAQLSINQRGEFGVTGTDAVWYIGGWNTARPRLCFGGTTSLFPAIKATSTAINFRLADDSADAPITASQATLSATLDLTIRTVTYGATMAIDAALGNKIAITLGGNGTISNPTNAVDGRVLVFRLRQDGSGNRVPVWDTKYAFVGDLATVTLSTAASKIDRIAFEYDSTDDKWYCISFIKGS